MLSKIKGPTVLIKANTSYDEELLVAALLDEDTDRVVELLSNGKRTDIDTSSHDIHYDKLKEFTKILVDFLEEM